MTEKQILKKREIMLWNSQKHGTHNVGINDEKRKMISNLKKISQRKTFRKLQVIARKVKRVLQVDNTQNHAEI